MKNWMWPFKKVIILVVTLCLLAGNCLQPVFAEQSTTDSDISYQDEVTQTDDAEERIVTSADKEKDVAVELADMSDESKDIEISDEELIESNGDVDDPIDSEDISVQEDESAMQDDDSYRGMEGTEEYISEDIDTRPLPEDIYTGDTKEGALLEDESQLTDLQSEEMVGAASVSELEGTTVYFGHYTQSMVKDSEAIAYLDENKKEDNKRLTVNGCTFYCYDYGEWFAEEPIEWEIIKDTGSEYVLLSKKILYFGPYNSNATADMSWKDSTMRSDLNDLYQKSFSDSEKAYIVPALNKTYCYPYEDAYIKRTDPFYEYTEDNVYLLSEEELGDLSTTVAYTTEYASSNTGPRKWWLRGNCSWFYGNLRAAYINESGNVSDWYITYNYGVRPAIRVAKNAEFSKPIDWEKKLDDRDKYTVKFNKNNSNASLKTTSKKVKKGEQYGTLPVPTIADKYNKYFIGWYTTNKGGTKITAKTIYTLSRNQTLYAKWGARKALKGASVTVKNVTYNQKPQTPAPTVTLSGKTLTKGTDYTVSYQSNINKGTGKVVIKGKGKYTGTLNKTFKINARKITDDVIHIQLKKTSVTYSNGKALYPGYIITYGNTNTILQKDKDFTVSYENNKNVGTGYLIITGKGNYCDKRRRSFKITQAPITIKQGLTSLTRTYKDKGKTYSVQVTPSTPSTLSYGTDNKNVAIVEKGRIKLVGGTGKAVIKVTAVPKNTNYARKTVKIMITILKKQTVKISGLGQYDSKTGYTVQYTPDKLPVRVTASGNGKVKYSITDKDGTATTSDIATVDSNGNITFNAKMKKVGAFYLTVKAAKTDESAASEPLVRKITVKKANQTIVAGDFTKRINEDSFNIGAQAQGKLSYKVSDGGGTEVSVDTDGNVSVGCKPGIAKIIISAGATTVYNAAMSKEITIHVVSFEKRTRLDGLTDSTYLAIAEKVLDCKLPNCTTYAYARALEIMKDDPRYSKYVSGEELPPFIVPGHSDAKYWMENNLGSANPLPSGIEPKKGAIAVWNSNLNGHVAVVEDISDDGTVYFSHSSFGGLNWNVKTPVPGTENNVNFHYEKKDIWGSELIFVGYIYLIDD